MNKEPKIGSINIPDRSNGPKTIKRPKDCHCHCVPIITKAWYEWKTFCCEVNGGLEHKHPGKGGWWRNGDCEVCKGV